MRTLLSIAFGILTGLLLAMTPRWVFDRADRADAVSVKHDRTVETNGAQRERAPFAPPAGSAARDARMEALEKRLLELESGDEAEQQAPAPVDFREGYAQEIREWQGRLAEHDAEPRNESWARTATASFTSDFAALSSEHGFAYGEPDCRSNSCTVEVEWSSHGVAATGYAELVHHSYGMSCARSIVLPEPEHRADPSRPQAYRTRILFERCGEELGRAIALDPSNEG